MHGTWYEAVDAQAHDRGLAPTLVEGAVNAPSRLVVGCVVELHLLAIHRGRPSPDIIVLQLSDTFKMVWAGPYPHRHAQLQGCRVKIARRLALYMRPSLSMTYWSARTLTLYPSRTK